MRILKATLCMTALTVGMVSVGLANEKAPSTTHHLSTTIEVVNDDGIAIPIKCYTVDKDGNVLVGIGGEEMVRVRTDSGYRMERRKASSAIRVYDQVTGEHLETWELSIAPEAMCTGFEGEIVVAGDGRIQILDDSGEVITDMVAPHAKILQENGEELRNAAIAAIEANKNMFKDQIEANEEILKKFEGREEADLSDAERAEKQSAAEMLRIMKEMTDSNQISVEDQMAQMRATKSKVSSVSMTDENFFIAVQALEGYGFEVWRADSDFEECKVVIKDLSGCCGQMDVRSDGGEIFVAENGRHRVGCYDLDGNLKYNFGERAKREGGKGFGSCCNPMNVAFSPKGDILAAEAEGTIKRFTREGDELQNVAVAKLPGGCKNVAIRTSPDGAVVYMVDIIGSKVLVFNQTRIAEASSTKENKAGE